MIVNCELFSQIDSSTDVPDGPTKNHRHYLTWKFHPLFERLSLHPKVLKSTMLFANYDQSYLHRRSILASA